MCAFSTGAAVLKRRVLPFALLASLMLGACAPRARPRVLPPATRTPRGTVEPAAASSADAIAAQATSLCGAPYRAGGSDTAGFDCSGLVQYVFAQAGVSLPRDVAGQYREGRKVDPDDIRPGDLLFFDTGGTRPSHVAIAVGDGAFVHAPSAGGAVRMERFTSYWSKRFVRAKRIVGGTL
jgi:murein DD-endopeptidase